MTIKSVFSRQIKRLLAAHLTRREDLLRTARTKSGVLGHNARPSEHTHRLYDIDDASMRREGPSLSHATDTRALRNALGTFATGVTVITARDASGAAAGFTANSFTSVSLDPPLVLFCLGRSAALMPVFADCERFVVNVLAAHQAEVSRVFASRDNNKFERVAHDNALAGGPRLADAVAWFDCEVHDRADGGDHDIIIGRVTAFGATDAEPLAYLRGQYSAITPRTIAQDD